MSFLFNSSWARGPIRSGHIHQTIRSNNSRLFNNKTFFHTYTPIRPSLGKRTLRQPKGLNLLWHYFNAPGNMLFLSTNLLGLSILLTYRCLYTIANHDRFAEQERINQEYNSLMKDAVMDLNYSDETFNLLKRKLEEKAEQLEEEAQLAKSQESAVEESMEELDDLEDLHDGMELTPESKFKSYQEQEEEFLPLTETELDHYGPPVQRIPGQERFQQLFINQLLAVHTIHDYIGQSFQKDGANLALLEQLSPATQESLISTLYDIITKTHPEEELEISSFEDFYKYLPIKDINYYIRASNVSFLKSELLEYTAKNLNEEDLENLEQLRDPTVPILDTKDIEQVLQKDSKSSSGESVHLRLAMKLLNTNTTSGQDMSFLYSSIFDSPKLFKNQNETKIAILLNGLFFHTKQFGNEKFFNKVMKTTIELNDTKNFIEGLNYLNLDIDSLKNKKRSRNWFARYFGSMHERKLILSLESYTTALEGMVKLNFEPKHIRLALNKVLSGLINTNGDRLHVMFSNRLHDFSKDTMNNMMKMIPIELFEVFISISEELKDNSFLSWCFKLAQVNDYFQGKFQKQVYEGLKSTAIALGDKELLHKLEQVYK